MNSMSEKINWCVTLYDAIANVEYVLEQLFFMFFNKLNLL